MTSYAIGFVHVENGVYGISFPDFPGCISTGDNLEGVILRGGQALGLHVEGMVEDGEVLPVPRTHDAVMADANFVDERKGAILVAIPVVLPGKAARINVTINENLLQALDRAASAEGSSRSGFLADAVRKKLETI